MKMSEFEHSNIDYYNKKYDIYYNKKYDVTIHIAHSTNDIDHVVIYRGYTICPVSANYTIVRRYNKNINMQTMNIDSIILDDIEFKYNSLTSSKKYINKYLYKYQDIKNASIVLQKIYYSFPEFNRIVDWFSNDYFALIFIIDCVLSTIKYKYNLKQLLNTKPNLQKLMRIIDEDLVNQHINYNWMLKVD